MSRRGICYLCLSFLLGLISMLVVAQICPAAGSDAEHQALADVNAKMGTDYAWCDACYETALEESKYWHSHGLGHRSGFYCYGHRGAIANCAALWLGSSGHREGIKRDYSSGDRCGAVANYGNCNYFCPESGIISRHKHLCVKTPDTEVVEKPEEVKAEEVKPADKPEAIATYSGSSNPLNGWSCPRFIVLTNCIRKTRH